MGEYIVVGAGKYARPDSLWWDVTTLYDVAHPPSEAKIYEAQADALMSQVRYLEYRQQGIHDGHRRHAELVLGYVPPALAWTQTSGATRREVLATKNAVRGACDTATAMIAKTMPKPTIITDGADWDVQQRAADLDRFLVGVYSRGNLYDTAQNSFRDSTIFGTGVWELVEREGAGGDYWIDYVRQNIDDVIVDEDECPGEPVPENFYVRTVMHVEKAVKRYAKGERKGEIEAHIRSAAGKPVMWPNGKAIPKDRVVIVRGWHMADDQGRGGVYCAACDGCYLDGGSWDFTWPPFVWLFWSVPHSGFYGDGIAYRQYGRQKRINYLYRWIERCQNLIANPRVWVDATNGPVKVQVSNEIGEIVSVRGRAPEFQSPQAVNQEMYAWLDSLERGTFEDEGISQFSATNVLPPGIESAPAQREYSFKEGSRFAPVSQRWENAVARDNAYKTLELYKRAHARGADPMVTWSSRKLSQVIPWDEVELDRERYQIRVEASSMEALSPAGRLQAVIELGQSGLVEPPELRRLMGHPDLMKSDDMDTAPEDYAMWVASKLLKGESVVPDPYSDLALVKKAVKSAYLRATMDPPAPQRIVKGILDFLRQLDTLMAPPPLPGGAMPPGAPPMPGAPGMTPPMAAGPSGLPVQAITPAAATGAIPFTGTA